MEANVMRSARIFLLATTALLGSLAAANADGILSGTITSESGEKLGGVTVSVKPVGGTITTTVFTDAAGDYVFPQLASGKYRLWAQAIGFATAKADLDFSAAA